MYYMLSNICCCRGRNLVALAFTHFAPIAFKGPKRSCVEGNVKPQIRKRWDSVENAILGFANRMNPRYCMFCVSSFILFVNIHAFLV